MDKKLAETIGNVARAARQRAGLTQADVAERLDMASEVYGRLERGLMLPSVPTFRKLCTTLGLSSAKALDLGIQEPFRAPVPPPGFGERPEVRRLLRRVQLLDRRKVRLLAMFAAALRG
ncbi:MAG TPA: helix-turn-helix transcriptional regulator [Gemmatimonadales bacterium]